MKAITNKLLSIGLGAALILGSTSCEKEDDNPVNPGPQPQTIAEIASDNSDFSILVDALKRTDLVDALNDPNASLTVFAPTNKAFQDLLMELGLADLDAVENALGTDGLKNVLLYHVLGAKVMSSDVTTGYVRSLAENGSADALSMYISTMSGVKINDRAMVMTPDLEASNGVIHVINKVILPQSIFELLKVNPDFSSLVTALTVADGDLDGLFMDATTGPFTVFGPDDEAFVALLQELNYADLNALVAALGTDGLSDVLTYHAVSGNVNSDEVPSGDVPTVNGATINISTSGGVMITDQNSRESNVKYVDIQGTNGVIHKISKVLLP